MKIITKKEFLEKKDFYKLEILNGKIFIYPTDTIYGLGCDSLNFNSVQKIKEIKKRDTKPFSIIVPSKGWILENCQVHKNHKDWIKKLPEQYTFIFKLKNGKGTIGIRMSKNWFSKFISEINICFITTSVNISGEKHLTKLEDLNDEIKKYVDYFIDDGELNGKPSMVVSLTEEKEKIIRN